MIRCLNDFLIEFSSEEGGMILLSSCLTELRRQGVRIIAQDNELLLVPADDVSPELKDAINTYKDHIKPIVTLFGWPICWRVLDYYETIALVGENQFYALLEAEPPSTSVCTICGEKNGYLFGKQCWLCDSALYIVKLMIQMTRDPAISVT